MQSILINKVSELLKNDTEYLMLTNQKLAEKYNCSKATVARALRNIGFKKDISFSQTNRAYCNKSKKAIVISDELEQIITGSLLGDGYIVPYKLSHVKGDRNKNKNSSLLFKHCEKQREYVKFKEDLISKHVKCYYRESIKHDSRFKVETYISINVETIQNSSFNYYRQLWYKPNKQIPFDSIKITPLVMAIWFQDDGSNVDCGYIISTQGFTTLEVSKLISIINNLFVLSCYMRLSKNQPYIYIPARDVLNFNNIVMPYMCESMMYKLIVRTKSCELRESPKKG